MSRAAGVPTPRFWPVDGRAGLEAVRDELVYPLIVKPHASIDFQERFGGIKHFAADDLAGARDAVARAEDAGLLGDARRADRRSGQRSAQLLHLDRPARASLRVHFSKRLLRRSPPGMGLATYHVTDWIPEIRDLALRLLGEVGLRGVAQVEFILDPVRRRQQAHRVQRALHPAELADRWAGGGWTSPGSPTAHAAGLPPEPVAVGFRAGVRLCIPTRTCAPTASCGPAGSLTFAGWIGSLRPAHLDTLSVRDPLPAAPGAPRAGRAPSRRRHSGAQGRILRLSAPAPRPGAGGRRGPACAPPGAPRPRRRGRAARSASGPRR